MKKLFHLILSLIVFPWAIASASDFTWHSSLDAAFKAASIEKKPIFLQFRCAP